MGCERGGAIRIDTEGEYLKKISRSVQDSFLPNDRFDHRLIAAFLKCYAGGTPVCTLRQASGLSCCLRHPESQAYEVGFPYRSAVRLYQFCSSCNP